MEYDAEQDSIRCVVSHPHAAEVWGLAPSPTQANLLASVSNSGALRLPALVHTSKPETETENVNGAGLAALTGGAGHSLLTAATQGMALSVESGAHWQEATMPPVLQPASGRQCGRSLPVERLDMLSQ